MDLALRDLLLNLHGEPPQMLWEWRLQLDSFSFVNFLFANT